MVYKSKSIYLICYEGEFKKNVDLISETGKSCTVEKWSKISSQIDHLPGLDLFIQFQDIIIQSAFDF
jgi:hypothetical protein